MKSIKRGRASSLTSGIVGIAMSIAFFGIATQVSSDFGEFAFVPMIMGLIVLGLSIGEIIGATRKNRFSEYDITDDGEEPDPLNQYYGGQEQPTQNWQSPTSAPVQSGTVAQSYCPYCGTCVEQGFAYCPSCGKRLPEGKPDDKR